MTKQQIHFVEKNIDLYNGNVSLKKQVHDQKQDVKQIILNNVVLVEYYTVNNIIQKFDVKNNYNFNLLISRIIEKRLKTDITEEANMNCRVDAIMYGNDSFEVTIELEDEIINTLYLLYTERFEFDIFNTKDDKNNKVTILVESIEKFTLFKNRVVNDIRYLINTIYETKIYVNEKPYIYGNGTFYNIETKKPVNLKTHLIKFMRTEINEGINTFALKVKNDVQRFVINISRREEPKSVIKRILDVIFRR